MTGDGRVGVSNARTQFGFVLGAERRRWRQLRRRHPRHRFAARLPENFFGGVFATIKATSDDAYRRLIAKIVEFYAQALFNPHWGEQIAFAPGGVLSISMVLQGLDQQQAEATWGSRRSSPSATMPVAPTAVNFALKRARVRARALGMRGDGSNVCCYVGGVRDRCSHDAAGHDVLESTVHGLGEAPYPTATLVADVIQKAKQSVVLWRPLRRRHGDHAADRDPEQVLGSSFGGSGDLRLGISPA